MRAEGEVAATIGPRWLRPSVCGVLRRRHIDPQTTHPSRMRLIALSHCSFPILKYSGV